MNTDQIDEFIYLKSKKALDSFFEYLKPAFDIVKNQELSLISENKNEIVKVYNENKDINNELSFLSENENEIVKVYNKNNVLYQINSTSLILELFLVLELFIKTELYKNNECFLYRSLEKYPEEKKKEKEMQEKMEIELEKMKKKIATSMKNKNEERYNILINDFVASLFDVKSPDDYISVSVNEALNRLTNYLHWDFSDEFIRKFNRMIYCRNEIVHFGKFNNLTIGVSTSMNVIHALANSAKDENQKGFYKCFSKLPDEYIEQNEYYNKIFEYIYLYEYWNKILQNTNDIFEKNK
jgi:hypothetical protein